MLQEFEFKKFFTIGSSSTPIVVIIFINFSTKMEPGKNHLIFYISNRFLTENTTTLFQLFSYFRIFGNVPTYHKENIVFQLLSKETS